MLTHPQFERLKAYAFSERNPGYRPEVQEAPNGDGVWDAQKKYAHVAPKYGLGPLGLLYRDLVNEATGICIRLGIPSQFFPDYDSTIRVLDYPPGATSAPHTDFDMFTMCLYRDVDAFRYLSAKPPEAEDFPGLHFGELFTEITGREATRHEVIATEKPQWSAVFFVMPPLGAVLPSGLSVGEWLQERKERSRR